jgi:hypothetical protein
MTDDEFYVSPAYWFMEVLLGVHDGDFHRYSEAQSHLVRLGWDVRRTTNQQARPLPSPVPATSESAPVLLTTRQLAQQLGYVEKTLLHWRVMKVIVPAARGRGLAYLWNLDDVKAALTVYFNRSGPWLQSPEFQLRCKDSCNAESDIA